MIIPLIVILLLIVSFFAKVPGGVQFAAIIFGLVALQVFLGIFSHSIPFVDRAARAERLRSSSGRRSPPVAAASVAPAPAAEAIGGRLA